MKLVHRDIKPSNVLISSDGGTVKWADFGLSKTVESNGRFQMSGMKGTSGYMAPEVLKNLKNLTLKSDIFSAGCVFFQVLAEGEHPFGSKEDSTHKIDSNIINGKPINIAS